MTPLLSVRGLTKRYGTTTALAGIDLDCHRGDCIAIVGESGSGKTTLGRILIGAETADAGEITFDGQPVPRHRGLALGPWPVVGWPLATPKSRWSSKTPSVRRSFA